MEEIKKHLEKYIGKLGTTIINTNYPISVNFMYQSLRLTPISVNTEGLSHGIKVLDPAPSINLETGVRVEISEGNIESELNENLFEAELKDWR